MHVPLQVNRFVENILLIFQYKYLKSFSGDFYSPESDPLHKIMRYTGFIPQPSCLSDFKLKECFNWK